MFLAAYRGQVDEVERMAPQVRSDGEQRREGYALSAANFAEAIVYNGAGRHAEALVAARRELPYTHELNHAMRTLLELVEAATRCGEGALATEAVERLASTTTPLGNDWSLGVLAMATAQLRDGREAEQLFREAIERFERAAIPIMVGRSRLLFGEALRRENRAVDAREQLRASYELLSRIGLLGFADRAARELRAAGETVRVRTSESAGRLTEQELNVARLARSGLTNRDIGSRLFISDRTAEYHLRKVFIKLGITSRAQLRSALADADQVPP
jgi:ATP/maltotriose-dependent transcriptional regulator MalT